MDPKLDRSQRLWSREHRVSTQRGCLPQRGWTVVCVQVIHNPKMSYLMGLLLPKTESIGTESVKISICYHTPSCKLTHESWKINGQHVYEGFINNFKKNRGKSPIFCRIKLLYKSEDRVKLTSFFGESDKAAMSRARRSYSNIR